MCAVETVLGDAFRSAFTNDIELWVETCKYRVQEAPAKQDVTQKSLSALSPFNTVRMDLVRCRIGNTEMEGAGTFFSVQETRQGLCQGQLVHFSSAIQLGE